MVTIRKINVCEFYDFIIYDKINTSLKNQCDSNNKEYFAVIDGERILGHALVVLFPDILTAKIIEIYILPQERKQGLGDALLRTVLHYLRINFFEYAIIKANKELDDFLINKEIKEINLQILTEQIKAILRKNYMYKYYICDIEEFFKRKCKGSQLI